MSDEILNETLLNEFENVDENNADSKEAAVRTIDYSAEDIFTHNLDLILNVPLQVSVQIGKTKKPIKEIIEFTKGTIVELNKLAGEQADVLVNGKCFAKGDVVIIDETFCVRITEIVDSKDVDSIRY